MQRDAVFQFPSAQVMRGHGKKLPSSDIVQVQMRILDNRATERLQQQDRRFDICHATHGNAAHFAIMRGLWRNALGHVYSVVDDMDPLFRKPQVNQPLLAIVADGNDPIGVSIFHVARDVFLLPQASRHVVSVCVHKKPDSGPSQ